VEYYKNKEITFLLNIVDEAFPGNFVLRSAVPSGDSGLCCGTMKRSAVCHLGGSIGSFVIAPGA